MTDAARPAEQPQPGEPPRGEISPRLTSATRAVHGLRVPMRDGVELALDLLRPDVPDPLPVVLSRTPYDKVSNSAGLKEQLAQRGYIVASNDCRGRFNSDGVFRPYFDEADDGYDTVEWIAAQDWCDGNIGMFGGSYSAQAGWFAASRRPPHLKAIVAYCSPPSTLWRNEPILGGCFLLSMAEWMVGMGVRSWQLPGFMNLFTAQQDYFDALPVSSLPERAGVSSAWWDEMMEHPILDDFWRQGSYDNHADMDVAALNITGWWDMNFPGAPLNFEAMRAGPAAARQKLIIGPWPHWVNGKRQLNGVDFGEHAIIELDDYVIRFFDRWLKGVENGIEHEKPVHVFVIGANEWWTEDDWPLPDAEEMPFYFHSGGNANSLTGDGGLSREPPGAEPHDAYAYDPADPGRIFWNLQDGPVDDRLPSAPRRHALLHQRAADRAARRRRPGHLPALRILLRARHRLARSPRRRPPRRRGPLPVPRRAPRPLPRLVRGTDPARAGEADALRVHAGRLRRPLPPRPPHPRRGDQLLVPAVRPQHQLRRRELLQRRLDRRRRPARLPRRGTRLVRRPPGRAAIVTRTPSSDLEGGPLSTSHSAVGGPAAVATSDRFAADAAAGVLREGGSAVDALVAAAAVQCVVGQGAMTIAGMWISNSYDATTGETTTVSSKIGPAEAEPYDYDWESPEAYSGRAMPVPSWPAGAHRAWEQDGRLSWARVLEPAIALADEGYALDVGTWARVRMGLLAARTAEGRELWMRDSRYLRVGEQFRQPALARTLRALAGGGPAAFYEGEFAQEYVAVARERGGSLTMGDMARWQERPDVRPAALVGDYGGFQVSSEGGLLVYALHLCQAADIGSLNEADAVFAQVRVLEEVFYATLEYTPATHDQFVDRGYAEARIDDVLNGPLRPTAFDQFWANTATIVARDGSGNTAWVVHSLNTPNVFGAGIIVGGAYAVRAISARHAREGDLLAPGLFAKIALYRDGRPHAIAASPGYSCVHSPIAFLVGLVQRGLEPLEAMAAPRFALPSPMTGNRQPFESHYPASVFAMLEERGLPYFESSPSGSFGGVNALVIEDDRVHALADVRGEGVAAAFPV